MKNIKYLSLLMVSIASSIATANEINFSTTCTTNTNARLAFVGDILIHKAIYKSVVHGSKDFSQIWKPVDHMIKKADFVVGNLEGPAALGIDKSGKDRGDVGFIYDGKVYSGTDFVFNFHPRIASDLKKSGYDLMSFANNHTLDRYSVGADKTLEVLREAGLYTAGVRTSYEEKDRYYSIANIQGINVAFIGCTESLNGRKDIKDQVLNCYNGEIESMIKDLSLNKSVDFIVVLPHWGEEYKTKPNSRQMNFARKYAEAGAGAIIGSHPHVPQPWEKYVTTSGRETLIVYSLGNFVAWQSGLNQKTGPIVYLNLSKDENNMTSISGVAYSLTQRQGSNVYPVSRRNKDFTRNGEKFYGKSKFVSSDESLDGVLCK